MAGNLGRDDLIKALGDAFKAPKADDPRDNIKVVSAVAGEKDVLRLVTNYNNASKKSLHTNHPDVVFVSKLVDEMANSKKSDIEIASRDLIVKFNKAVDNNDEEKISSIVKICKAHYMRLQSVSVISQERALVYMVILDAIKKM